jgi:hypothetical protein
LKTKISTAYNIKRNKKEYRGKGCVIFVFPAKRFFSSKKAVKKDAQSIIINQNISININIFNFFKEVTLTEKNFLNQNRKLAALLGVNFLTVDGMYGSDGISLKAKDLQEKRLALKDFSKYKFMPTK